MRSISRATGRRGTPRSAAPYARGRLDLEALRPVVRGELPLAINANRASDLLAAMRLADEFQLKLILMGAAEGWRVADRARGAQGAGRRQAADRHPELRRARRDARERRAAVEGGRRRCRARPRSTRTTRATCGRRPATRSPTASIATPRCAPSRSNRRGSGASPIASDRSKSARTPMSWSGPAIRSS